MGRASRESQSHRVTESKSHRVTESPSHRVTVTESQSHIHLCLRLNNQRWRDFSSHYSSCVLRSAASPPTPNASPGNTGVTKTARSTFNVSTDPGRHAVVGRALFGRSSAPLVWKEAANTLASIVPVKRKKWKDSHRSSGVRPTPS